MPRENRKRGRRKKSTQSAEQDGSFSAQLVSNTSKNLPSLSEDEQMPFGFVNNDVKAYFRTVDIQIRDWQGASHEDEQTGDAVSDEERNLFFVAALTEMRGKEKQLATDPECSAILERMIYSMDDFVRRVFMDSLAGSFERLVRHRFASHVCQTLFSVADETVSREARGILPHVPDDPEQGKLRTMTQLILEMSEELLPSFSSLISDPFASHVVRSLLLLLCPSTPPGGSSQTSIRSRKIGKSKARQNQMKCPFTGTRERGKDAAKGNTPATFGKLSRRFVEALRVQLGDNEIRALASDKVASPALQILLEVEADQDMTNEDGSLMDKLTIGFISAHRRPNLVAEASDYLNILLRDSTSSRLFETIISRAPSDAFTALWAAHFKGKLPTLSVHPVANFVLAKALERVSSEQLTDACTELNESWSRVIRSSTSGVLRAMIDRSVTLRACEAAISKAAISAFGLTTSEDCVYLVPCVLRLLSLQDYMATLAGPHAGAIPTNEPDTTKAESNILPTIQGSVLLQSLLRLSHPHNQSVINSLMSLSVMDRVQLSHNAHASWIIDALLQSSTVPLENKNQLILEFIGHYHNLVNDRFGSRIGDRCWAFADTYLKEKIARSLFPQKNHLASSPYGRFFLHKLNLHLLQLRPEEWRSMQADRKLSTCEPIPPITANVGSETHSLPAARRRKRQKQSHVVDEIDIVFNDILAKKSRSKLHDSQCF